MNKILSWARHAVPLQENFSNSSLGMSAVSIPMQKFSKFIIVGAQRAVPIVIIPQSSTFPNIYLIKIKFYYRLQFEIALVLKLLR
jgi:hypothetical protein